jgi:hypothetical protein
MLKKDLIELLSKYPDDMEVWAGCEGHGDLFPIQEHDIQIISDRVYTTEPYRNVISILTHRS